MSWNRLLWGVEFTGSNGEPARLIGGLWHEAGSPRYTGEPTRAVLFESRRQAREWCAKKNDSYKQSEDFVNRWRVRPARVRETVVLA